MNLTTKLSIEHWKKEIKSSNMPERIQELLTKALLAVISGKDWRFPRLTEEEFGDLVDNHVVCVQLGEKRYILEKKARGNIMWLVLQREEDEE